MSLVPRGRALTSPSRVSHTARRVLRDAFAFARLELESHSMAKPKTQPVANTHTG